MKLPYVLGVRVGVCKMLGRRRVQMIMIKNRFFGTGRRFQVPRCVDGFRVPAS